MINTYMNNFENIISSILFLSFKIIVIVLILLLILSLILLAIGCLIKSQKLKSKFLIVVPSLVLVNILLLVLPLIFVHLKNII